MSHVEYQHNILMVILYSKLMKNAMRPHWRVSVRKMMIWYSGLFFCTTL